MAGVRGRHTVANYLNVGKDEVKYVLMGAGFTELNETPTALTSSKRYINDKSATKGVIGYDWSTPYIVDLDKPSGSAEGVYQARKFHVAIAVTDFPNNEGIMASTGTLLGIGDPVLGTFHVATKVFTEDGKGN